MCGDENDIQWLFIFRKSPSFITLVGTRLRFILSEPIFYKNITILISSECCIQMCICMALYRVDVMKLYVNIHTSGSSFGNIYLTTQAMA